MGVRTIVVGVVLLLAGVSSAQEPAAEVPAAETTAGGTNLDVATGGARPQDVVSVDAIVDAFYDVISGPAGAPRQWERDRSLYAPGARFVAVGVKAGETAASVEVTDHQQYVDRSDATMVRDGFFEHETHRITRRFGNIAHVMSTYEAQNTPDGPVIERGVNSLSLYFDGQRWWIASATWDVERPGNPIPQEFMSVDSTRGGGGATGRKAGGKRTKKAGGGKPRQRGGR